MQAASRSAIAVENARLYRQAEETAAIAERTRLARELHDSVTQSLYSVTLFAEASARLLAMDDYANAAENLRELRDTAQEALAGDASAHLRTAPVRAGASRPGRGPSGTPGRRRTTRRDEGRIACLR